MIRNKLIFVLIFTILLTSFVISVPIVKIYYPQSTEVVYSNDTSLIFKMTVDLNDNCDVNTSISINISSDQTSPFNFPISCNIDRIYSGNFSISFTESNNSPPVPIILVDTEDTVVFTYTTASAQLIVDTVRPVVGNFDLNYQGANVGNYYKGNVILDTIAGFSDNHSGIKKYTAYVVPILSLDNYKTENTKKLEVTNFEGTINLALPTGVVDGNYYVLLDVVDQLDNSGLETTVKNNKKIMYVDNSPPEVTSFNIGDFVNAKTYYVKASENILDMTITDYGVGIKDENLDTQLDRNEVKLVDFNAISNKFYFDFTEVDHSINGSYKLALTDNLDNTTLKTFNIVIDENAPTVPTVPTLSINVDNNVTVSAWGNATDPLSGVKEYKVYRSTSSFTTVTNQSLVCTVAAAATKSCIDTSSKSSGTRYYYGVSATDNAGNESGVLPVSIVTGPALTIDVDSPYSNYVNTATPLIELTYSDDVNAVRFSCDASTFTSWIDVSGTSLNYDSFNITSGNGCNTNQGEKTIYVEVKSEDDPYPVTRKSKLIKYDSVAPTTPLNVNAVSQTNGSIKVTWSSSSDVNGSGVEEYRVYYSDSQTVSDSSLYFTTSNTEYTYSPNLDQNFYFKVSAIDNVLNESALSSMVTERSRRQGPSFSFNVTPKNIVDSIIYLKKGNALFTITSDQVLKQTPTVRLKIGEGQFQTLTANYNNLVTTVSHNFQQTGNAILEITGINNNNESATDQFTFYADSQDPTFDINYSFVEDTNIFLFDIENYSDDLLKVQYLLNDSEEVCFIESILDDFVCSFDSTLYQDGDYSMHVIAYDKALNFLTKSVSFEIDDVDEEVVLKANLISEIYKNIKIIEDKIFFLQSISFKISEDILSKVDFGKSKLAEAKILDDANNFSEAINTYTTASISLMEVLDVLPKENLVKTRTIKIDLNNHNYDLNNIILDQNFFLENIEFYSNFDFNLLNIQREFSVFEISGQHYYSSVLDFKNDSQEEKVISFIEVIPKEFSRLAKDIYFDRDIVVIDEDPIILYNMILPANSVVSTRYISKNPITNFDVLTKYDAITYQEPLLLSGFVEKENLDFSRPFMDTKLLFLIAVITLIIIIVLLVIWLVASSGKKKDDVLTNISAKDSMNKYLGESGSNTKKADDIPEKSEIEKKEKFNSNYEYIINAVKRSNK